LQLRLGREVHRKLGVSIEKLEEQSRAQGEGGPVVTVEVIDTPYWS
jgi:hypothetical protein